jgi:hypothetical protein
MRLIPGYLIHGTNKPYGIGMQTVMAVYSLPGGY